MHMFDIYLYTLLYMCIYTFYTCNKYFGENIEVEKVKKK